MWLDIIILIVGLAMLVIGGERLIEGASVLAYRWGWSQRVVGLTLVAFGTSAPELFVNLLASYYGQAEVTLGNIIGSNIFNLLAVLGLVALFRPVRIERSLVLIEIPLSFLVGVALLLLINDQWWTAQPPVLQQHEGLVLLIFFAMFLYTITFLTRRQRGEEIEIKVFYPTWRAALYFIIGTILLAVGAELTVRGAVQTALHLGVSVFIVSVLAVALGTSLPELVTSVIAFLKGMAAVSVANLVGSNIFNVAFIMALSAVVRPIPYKPIYNVDLLVYIVTTMLLWLYGMGLRGHRLELRRRDGILMLLLFVLYLGYIFVREAMQ